MTQSWAQAARLVRCTGFGATGAEVDAASRLSRAAYVAGLFAPTDQPDPGAVATPPPVFAALPSINASSSKAAEAERYRESYAQRTELLGWWVRRMIAVERAFGERLTFAWHGIFATSLDKVEYPNLMLIQNITLRALATGDFRALALAMLTDPALIRWLDNQKNTKAAPNENLAREFMELFALGHGNGYTETDVRQGARALTGWTVDPNAGTAKPVPAEHDDGTKTVLGVTGNLDHVGFCDAVLAQAASAPFVVGRLWNQLISDQAVDAATRSVAVAAYGGGRDVTAALTAMFTSPGFDSAAGTRVLSPVEWAIGLARAVAASPDEETADAVMICLRSLGQIPFHPPSVGGWPGGQAWLSSSALTGRWDAALRIITQGQVNAVDSAASSARLDAVAHLLGVATWSDRSAAALQPFVSDPEHLVAAASMTPEYLTV